MGSSNRVADVEVEVLVDGTLWLGWLDPQLWRDDLAGDQRGGPKRT